MRFVILPGNGGGSILSSNWYGWLAQSLSPKVEVIARDMPDPYVARESAWIPFIKDELKVDEHTIVVGHSSGACCAMRLAETIKLGGVILVSAAHTDLGDENERASGYFSRPWDWDAIKTNTKFIHQFHSTDDHLIPVSEARYIADMLKGPNFTYEELNGHSHFFDPFPELIDVCNAKIEADSDGNDLKDKKDSSSDDLS